MVTSQPLGFETTREAFRRGAYDYLWKPPEDSLLQQIINLLVEREERERQLAYQQTLLKRRLSISYEVQSDAEQAQVLYKMRGDGA
jgi:FixJ family two-component response regulator